MRWCAHARACEELDCSALVRACGIESGVCESLLQLVVEVLASAPQLLEVANTVDVTCTCQLQVAARLPAMLKAAAAKCGRASPTVGLVLCSRWEAQVSECKAAALLAARNSNVTTVQLRLGPDALARFAPLLPALPALQGVHMQGSPEHNKRFLCKCDLRDVLRKGAVHCLANALRNVAHHTLLTLASCALSKWSA
jgi:hypothetical protein